MITKTIRTIIALADKKPILALITILLIGLSTLSIVIKVLDSRFIEREKQARIELAACNREKEENEKQYQENIEKINQQFRDFVVDVNKGLQERIDKVDNVTKNTREAIDNAKSTVKSQSNIIKKLKDSTENGK